MAAKDLKQVTEADWNFRQNASQFARQGYAIQGPLTAAMLARAKDGDVRAGEILGSVQSLQASIGGRAGFEVSVIGPVGLSCQSCGVEFDLLVDSRSTIHVARDAAELADWDDEAFESIEANEKTSALELVEDELLLSVPYVPRCPKCEADDKPRIHEFN